MAEQKDQKTGERLQPTKKYPTAQKWERGKQEWQGGRIGEREGKSKGQKEQGSEEVRKGRREESEETSQGRREGSEEAKEEDREEGL